jgi:hypothetical protein
MVSMLLLLFVLIMRGIHLTFMQEQPLLFPSHPRLLVELHLLPPYPLRGTGAEMKLPLSFLRVCGVARIPCMLLHSSSGCACATGFRLLTCGGAVMGRERSVFSHSLGDKWMLLMPADLCCRFCAAGCPGLSSCTGGCCVAPCLSLPLHRHQSVGFWMYSCGMCFVPTTVTLLEL